MRAVAPAVLALPGFTAVLRAPFRAGLFLEVAAVPTEGKESLLSTAALRVEADDVCCAGADDVWLEGVEVGVAAWEGEEVLVARNVIGVRLALPYVVWLAGVLDCDVRCAGALALDVWYTGAVVCVAALLPDVLAVLAWPEGTCSKSRVPWTSTLPRPTSFKILSKTIVPDGFAPREALLVLLIFSLPVCKPIRGAEPRCANAPPGCSPRAAMRCFVERRLWLCPWSFTIGAGKASAVWAVSKVNTTARSVQETIEVRFTPFGPAKREVEGAMILIKRGRSAVFGARPIVTDQQ